MDSRRIADSPMGMALLVVGLLLVPMASTTAQPSAQALPELPRVDLPDLPDLPDAASDAARRALDDAFDRAERALGNRPPANRNANGNALGRTTADMAREQRVNREAMRELRDVLRSVRNMFHGHRRPDHPGQGNGNANGNGNGNGNGNANGNGNGNGN